jgi:hypothetical protein
VRVGVMLDGAVVYYHDGTKIPCGPRGVGGEDPSMGGHQARKIALPEGVEISKVAVTTNDEGHELYGLRIWLSNGKAMGALNYKRAQSKVHTLGRLAISPGSNRSEAKTNRRCSAATHPQDHRLLWNQRKMVLLPKVRHCVGSSRRCAPRLGL